MAHSLYRVYIPLGLVKLLSASKRHASNIFHHNVHYFRTLFFLTGLIFNVIPSVEVLVIVDKADSYRVLYSRTGADNA